MIFDGRAFAQEMEEQVKLEVEKMESKPKIVSILIGGDPASELYTKLKMAVARRVGIEFEVVRLDILKNEIEEIGKREDVTGVMVQLPIPNMPRGRTPRILEGIPLSKDVDGLRWEESKVKPATVRAIFSILDKIAGDSSATLRTSPDLWRARFVVVGARGVVGRPLCYYLRQKGVEVVEVEWDTKEPTRRLLEGQVVISCVGKARVVTGEMVREGAIVVDVGAPRGDMTSEVYQKASVAVAVPGGVGPVTIASLLQNAVEMHEIVL